MFKNMKLGAKIIAGYMVLIAFVAVTGGVGYNGIKQVAHSLFVVANEEAPVVDMAMEMKYNLMVARDAMGEFKSATTVMATDDQSSLESIEQDYQQALDDFDTFSDAIIEGKILDDGTVVLKSDNEQLINLVQQSNQIHDDRFQTAASEMMAVGRDLLKKKAESSAAMEAVEVAVNGVIETLEGFEVTVAEMVEEKRLKVKTQSEIADLFQRDVPILDCAMELSIVALESRIIAEEFAQATQFEQIEELEKELEQAVEAYDEIISALLEGGMLNGTRIYQLEDLNLLATVMEVDKAHTPFEEGANVLIASQRAMIAAAEQSEAAMEKMDAAGDEAGSILVRVEELAAAEMEAAKKEGNSAVQRSTFWVVVTLVCAVIIGILIGVILSRSITKPINRIIEQLGTGSDQVSSASSQVASSSQQMAEGASEQASSLEETSASMEEMGSMSRQNADNAREANNLSGQTAEAATTGNEAMGRMSQAIDEIKKSSDETAKIIKTIDEIAFQTNLLALNAAVEAARAGEAGKGFAVVAEEVRNLAMRSAEAARTTSDMIEGSQKNADTGVQVAQEVAEALGTIVSSVQKVTGLINEISAASDEQAKGVDQINAAMTQMDSVTQANASNAEESASASEEMNAQAAELKKSVQDLQQVVGGQRAMTSTTATGTTTWKQQDKWDQSRTHHVKDRIQTLLHKKETRPATKPGNGGPKGRHAAPKDLIPLEEGEHEEFENAFTN